METKYTKQLFDIMMNKKDDYELSIELEKFIEEVIVDCVCEQKTEMYLFLSELSNSINNAGHEERRSGDIDKLNKKRQGIIDFMQQNNREDFLP